MKKKLPIVKGVLTFMKITLLQIFIAVGFSGLVMAASEDSYGQGVLDNTVSLSAESVELGNMLEQIEKLTSAKFSFNPKTIPIGRHVSVDARNVKLGDLLETVLDPIGISYEASGKYVILRNLRSKGSRASRDAEIRSESDYVLSVSGTVTAETGEPLPGVNVIEKGTTNGTTTDANGKYSIMLPEGDVTLLFSFIGYVSQEIAVNGRTMINVSMVEDIQSLGEVVVVGYGTQKKTSVTAAVSTLSGETITQNPVANVNNSLAGRVAGVLTFQNSGEPGADAADIRVRGIGTIGSNSGALTVVDGVPRSFSQINPNEIESITVLKDAAAIAPYGVAGANGVILITTKRGKEGQVSLGYNAWYGIQRPTRYPEYLDAYGFASTLNIARANAGLAPQYTDDELQKYRDGSDPDHFPNHDWLREVVDFSAPMTSHNLTLSGGSEKVRFFSSLGYLYQQGSVDVINYSRYNLATNVDVNATQSTVISFDIRGSLEVTKNPGSQTGTGIYTQVTKQPPLLSNQLSFTNGLPGNTLLPSIYNSGYNNDQENILYTQISIEQRIPAIKGLSFKGVAAYDKNYAINKQWETPYVYYTLNSSDEFVELKGGQPAPRLSQAFNQGVNTTLQGYITYENTFGKHNVSALAVAERRQGDGMGFQASRINYQVNLDELDLGSSAKSDLDNGGSSSQSKQIGFVYRVGYGFSEKYLVELSGRYDGHYYFAPGERFAFFPAVSLGWRLSEEAFIKDNLPWIENLKLRGSYGKSGNLAGSPFQYLSSYGLESSYIFGGSQVQGAFERNEPNVNITWETAKKLDVGIEGSFLSGRLGFEFDIFREKRSDMLVAPNASVPAEYGIGISQVNAGIMENRGFDLALTTFNTLSNGFKINGGVTLSYAQNELIQTFENAATFNNPNRRRTGRPLGTQFGLRALGLFQTQEEINGWATQFGTLQPGDIKYDDVNGDGKITDDDEVVIGDPAFPQMIYGITGNFSWKGFDLSMLWQGAAKSNFQLTNEASNPFFNGAKIFKEQLDYWTPENRDAAYPVIMPSPTTNSTQVSSWWMRDGSYLRLKNLEFGYTVPKALTERISMVSLRVFTSGQNLLTFSSEDYLDPEIGVSSASKRARYYFQQKVYTFGLNVSF